MINKEINFSRSNNRLKLTAHLAKILSARGLSVALGGLKSDVNELGLTGEMVLHTIPP